MSTPDAAHAHPRRGRKSLGILLLIVVLAGGLTAWQVVTHRGLESTDNAQLEAEVVPVPARIAGPIIEVLVADNARVEKDEVLARIDDRQPRARLAQAEAAVKAAEAQATAAELDAKVASTNASGNFDIASATHATAETAVASAKVQLREAEASMHAAQAAYAQARADLSRDETLFRDGVIAESALSLTRTRATVASSTFEAAKAHVSTLRANIDQAASRIGEASARVAQTKDVDTLEQQANARAAAARAQVEVARAALAVAQLDVDYTVIRAPRAGTLSKKSVVVGQMVAPGQPIAQLVTDDLWVTANFKETQVADMRAGQRVRIEVDAFPSLDLEGEIDSLAGATGARFSLLPPDNASGNFTKVVQRVPVRVRLGARPEGFALRAGLSVAVTVDTRTPGAPAVTVDTRRPGAPAVTVDTRTPGAPAVTVDARTPAANSNSHVR